jgi:lipoprotein NlpD
MYFMRFHTLRLSGLFFLFVLISACGSNPAIPVTDLSPLDRRVTQYTVIQNDTLHAISFRTGISFQNLAKWNGLKSPYRIYVGDVLRLKPGTGTEKLASGKSTEAQKPARPAAPNPVSRPAPARTVLASKPLRETPLPATVSAWQWPAKGKLIKTFSAKNSQFGIEIQGNRSSAVVSTAPGQVVYVGNGIKGYGEMVIVKHSAKYISAYAYNDHILVKEGDQVKAGQRLANMGSTGTRGVKLHFEIRKNGEPVNPLRFLPLKSS